MKALPFDPIVVMAGVEECFLVRTVGGPHPVTRVVPDTVLSWPLPDRLSDPAENGKLWRAFQQRFPDGNVWLGGPTAFQFGWSHNAVRYVLGREGVGNPAIWTLRPKGAAA